MSFRRKLQSDDAPVAGDAHKSPVPGATVYADLNTAVNGMIPTDTSDREGRFSITVSSLGTYTIYGSKVEDGYPLTISGFHQQVRLDQVPANHSERTEDSN